MRRQPEVPVDQIPARRQPARLPRAELAEEGGRDGTEI